MKLSPAARPRAGGDVGLAAAGRDLPDLAAGHAPAGRPEDAGPAPEPVEAARGAALARANAALQETLDALARDRGLDSFLGGVVTAVVRQLGGEAAELWLEEPACAGLYRLLWVYQQGRLLSPEAAGHPDAGRLVPVPAHRQAHFRQHRAPLRDDLRQTGREEDEQRRQRLRAQGVDHLLSVPLLNGERIVGTLVVSFLHADRLDSPQLALAQALANQASLAVQLTTLSDEAKRQAAQAAVLAERNRIAREIHDTLAQGFTGVTLQAQALEKAWRAGRPELVEQSLALIKQLARDSLAEARRSIWELGPGRLPGGEEVNSTLGEELTRLAEQTIRAVGEPVRCVGVVRGRPRPLSAQVEFELRRIVQEAVHNAARHAHARRIVVALRFWPGTEITVRVRDDGVGIADPGSGAGPAPVDSGTAVDPGASVAGTAGAAGGFGLQAMRQRAARLGGRLSVRRRRGGGTEVRAFLPRGGG